MSFSLDLSPAGAIERFKEFLRIRTITNEGPTTGAHKQAMEWLANICKQADLSYTILEYCPGWPIFLIHVPGQDSSLPAILLNSHYDVVPIFPDKWNYPAFEAVELPNGDIVARGAQDMKCVCMAYLESLLRLKQSGATKDFQRSLYLSFTPDEETGGFRGMHHWVTSKDFPLLNIGFALDEGIANPGAEFITFYGERAVWWLHLRSEGPTGHGSRFIENTANEKLITTINRFLAFRKEQKSLLESAHENGCSHAAHKQLELGDVVSVNLTMLRSGVTVDNGKTFSINVIPMEAEAGFDIRIPPTVDLKEFEEKLQSWLEPGISYSFYQKVEKHSLTSLDEQENAYWKQFKSIINSMNYQLKPEIFPAGTDGRYMRELGIPTIGFSPLSFTPVLLHDHDERVNKQTYLNGVGIYEKVIPGLVNLLENSSTDAQRTAAAGGDK